MFLTYPLEGHIAILPFVTVFLTRLRTPPGRYPAVMGQFLAQQTAVLVDSPFESASRLSLLASGTLLGLAQEHAASSLVKSNLHIFR